MSDKFAIFLYASTLAPFAACAITYGWRSPWYRSALGRVLMGLLLSICAVLTLGVLVRVLSYDGPVIDMLRFFLLAAVNVAGWGLFVQFLHLQARTDPDSPGRRSTDSKEIDVTRDFLLDLSERAIKTLAQSLIAYFGAGALDVVSADWGEALTVAGTATLLSVLTSLVSLRLGNKGTASVTDAVVPAAYADAIARGRGAAGLADGPRA